MPTSRISIIKGDDVGVETDYRDALPVNMYAVKRDILGSTGYLLSYPGLKIFATGFGVDRGGIFNERFKKHFRVSGQKFIEIDSLGVAAELGDVPGSSQVSLPYSFNTQAIIADGKYFLYDPTNGFREVTDTDLGNPIDAVWVDGYYFFTDGENIYHTDITDEEKIDPLTFAAAEFMPDDSLAVSKTQDNKVMVFGRYSLEYFVNVAASNFAFQRVETRAQKIGIVATHAKCHSGGNVYITGGRKEEGLGVFVLGIGSSKRVSTREVEKILNQYSEPELSDMRMESRTEDDVSFVILNLPFETLCFNETIAKSLGIEYAWTILKTGFEFDFNYRAINGIFESNIGKWIYGDKMTSGIAELDNSICTQYGEKTEVIFYSPLLKLERASIDEVDIDIIPGFTASKDATVAISLTYDGVTYGKEWFNLYGLPKIYDQRFVIRRLGYVRDNIGFKFRSVTSSRMAFSGFKLTYG